MRVFLFFLISSVFLFFTIGSNGNHLIYAKNTIQSPIYSNHNDTSEHLFQTNSTSQLNDHFSFLLFDFEIEKSLSNSIEDETHIYNIGFIPQIIFNISLLCFLLVFLNKNNNKKLYSIFHFLKHNKKFLEIRSLRI